MHARWDLWHAGCVRRDLQRRTRVRGVGTGAHLTPPTRKPVAVRRSIRLAVLTAAVGLIAPVAASQTAVSAVDQDLVLSATSGEPGALVTVTSASCDTGDDENGFGYLWVRLVSGTAPSEVLAGSAYSLSSGVATLIVPDWLDPSAPAAIEATCVHATFPDDLDDPDGEVTITRAPYDPVAFDVLAGAGAPVQTRTYSRTSLQVGQAFSVAASGCFLDDPDHAYVDVLPGNDLTFRTLDGPGVSGEADVDGDGFEVPTALINSGISTEVSGDSSGGGEVTIGEHPTDLAPGTYSSIAYCTKGDTTLMFEPQLIEVTGSAPVDDIDLASTPDSRSVTFAGGSCNAGDVSAFLSADDLTEAFGDAAATRASDHPLSPAGLVLGSRRAAGGSPFPQVGAHRTLGGEPADLVLTPAADGSWSHQDDVAFDRALVFGYAYCGDPLADGFIYDAQATAVRVEPVDTTTSVPGTTPPPSPAPADAVTGTPTYAG